MSVKITFLGGLGEIGRNCAAIEHDGKIALVDCGLMFPEADMLGVDLVFPNWEWLTERKADVECVIVTHGHEDHVGALAYFLKEFPGVPVYGTELSVALARGRVDEIGVEADFIGCEDNRWVEHRPFGFMFVPVSHSIPQGAGIVFDTPEGFVVHSGDFKLDPTPVDGRPTDLQQFAHFGREGVRLLMADSTNAEVPGLSLPRLHWRQRLARSSVTPKVGSWRPASPRTSIGSSRLPMPGLPLVAKWHLPVDQCTGSRRSEQSWEFSIFLPRTLWTSRT